MSEQKTPTRADVIAMRREAIAAMRARGLSLRQIRESLANLDEPIVVSHGTVVRDVKALREAWKKAAAQSIDEWIAKELADLDELEKQVWRSKRYDLVLRRLRSIEQRPNLLDEITADHESRLEDLEDDEE